VRVDLLLGAVPHGIDQQKVLNYLSELKGVTAVHDLHIWALSTREFALTAHLVMPQDSLSDNDYLEINHMLKDHFNISHVTLQVEKGDAENPCGRAVAC
jgi:cobalt-zinc-cadmium efflux system protein